MNILETLSLAFASLRANKLRASLTILGIVVGIFSIIVIMTIITMLQNSIESGVSQLGKNTFQIQKFPAMMTGGPDEWRKYRNRKDIDLEEFERLKKLLVQAKYVGAEYHQWGQVIQYEGEKTNPDVRATGVTPDAMMTNEWVVEEGRPLRDTDVDRSNPVVILGVEVADKLFPYRSPVGEQVKVGGTPMTIIGVLEKQGEMFGQSRDNLVIIPISLWMKKYGKHRSLNITVTSFSKQDYNKVIDAAIGYMRTIRKVPPGQEDDFSIFSNESLLGQINDMTQYVELGAMVISFIALLAAGVGIMNIMLVSVTERTREIGIRKAIGAKKRNVLFQFLIEAIVLCLFGGFVGIVMGVGLGNYVGSFMNATAAVPVDWIMIGLGLCVLVGVIFGTYPAYKAANLDPIEALRFE